MEEKSVKELSKDDIQNGLEFKAIFEEVEGRYMAAKIAYETYIEILQKRYNAPRGEFELNDWAVGFEPVSEDD